MFYRAILYLFMFYLALLSDLNICYSLLAVDLYFVFMNVFVCCMQKKSDASCSVN